MVLHEGCISEMGTGEGKLLLLRCQLILMQYLATRFTLLQLTTIWPLGTQSGWVRFFPFLGLTVGTSISGMSGEEKQKAYSCDITYATNNELGFDYLRDNMAFSSDQKMLQDLSFAIIDEG
jgi:preprotein translocase subunit SecA